MGFAKRFVTGAFLSAALFSGASAADYPTKPVRFLQGFAPENNAALRNALAIQHFANLGTATSRHASGACCRFRILFDMQPGTARAFGDHRP